MIKFFVVKDGGDAQERGKSAKRELDRRKKFNINQEM
jgi:hypothetical protein